VDGLTRDVREITEMGFPVFVRGVWPTDSLGRIEIVDYDVPVECGGAAVNPEDLVFSDVDGVVVVPSGVEHEVIEGAFEKVSGENEARDALRGGMKTSQAFAKYGIL
jgi:4-hydroxy-4-methyl-2-oxoglutarate aldolase